MRAVLRFSVDVCRFTTLFAHFYVLITAECIMYDVFFFQESDPLATIRSTASFTVSLHCDGIRSLLVLACYSVHYPDTYICTTATAGCISSYQFKSCVRHAGYYDTRTRYSYTSHKLCLPHHRSSCVQLRAKTEQLTIIPVSVLIAFRLSSLVKAVVHNVWNTLKHMPT